VGGTGDGGFKEEDYLRRSLPDKSRVESGSYTESYGTTTYFYFSSKPLIEFRKAINFQLLGSAYTKHSLLKFCTNHHKTRFTRLLLKELKYLQLIMNMLL